MPRVPAIVRRKRQQPGSGVSLFPFLAVLLCTMGALVILLVAMSHAASRRAADAASERSASGLAAAEDGSSGQRARRQALLDRADQAASAYRQRAAAADRRLRDDQLRLSQIEGHIRRLAADAASYRAAVVQLQADQQRRLDDHTQAERSLAQLRGLIDETKQEIAELRAEQEGRHKSYAVVPYSGANGTQRQPIYIECLADRVVLQPEGVELLPDDFRQPLGVGNPLAAALRATREHLAQHNAGAGYDPDAEPYPLIVVRPAGVELYYRVREAIRSWDSDFGYELVNADWELDYSAPDPSLNHAQRTAIKHARMRRALLAKAAPRAYAGGGGSGFPAVAGQRGEGGAGLPYQTHTQTLRVAGGGRQGSGGGEGDAAGPAAAPTRSVAGPFATLDKAAQDPAGPATHSTRPGEHAAPGGPAGLGPTGMQQFAESSSAGPDGLHETGSDTPTQTPGTGVGPPGVVSRAAAAEAPGGSPGAAAGGNAGQASTAAGAANGTPSFAASTQASGRANSGWDIERPGPGAIAIRRTVGVLVRRRELVVLDADAAPGPGRASRGERVPLDGPTDSGMGRLATAMRRRVRSWGMAGQGLYWRPVLKLHVAPDGVDRAEQLIRLLEGSGVEVSHQRIANPPGPQRGTHAIK